ncbi:MAG: hypothetical protein ACKV22_31905 [Bryobacteraceae bacterium]
MDNITFANWSGRTAYAYGINAIGNMFGVLDHNTVTGSGGYLQLVEFAHAGYLNSGNWGDTAWNQPEDFGTNKFLFAENNSLTGAGLSENEASARSYEDWGGGRMVARFNSFTVTDGYNFTFGWHGTESSGRPRSTRAFEFYGNTYTCTYSGGVCQDMVASRGGTGLVWGNTINHPGTTVATAVSMQNYRVVASLYPWGACDGSSPYDVNDGVTYWSGTVGSVSGSNPATLTVSGVNPGWTSNRWAPTGAPYSVHDVTKNNGSEIASNGSNTLVIKVGGGGPGDWAPSPGDSIQILRATACIDQPGRGLGQLYGGDFPPTPAASSGQLLVPGYIWSNTLNNGNTAAAFVYSVTGRVIRNRDYYMEDANQAAQTNSTSPFNGTTTVGMGHGTLANRPTTCTTGVGYWVTDQGSWNQSGSGGQGQLYKCTATDTWTLYYTPYTYPHLLAAQGTTTTPPAPPTNLLSSVN